MGIKHTETSMPRYQEIIFIKPGMHRAWFLEIIWELTLPMNSGILMFFKTDLFPKNEKNFIKFQEIMDVTIIESESFSFKTLHYREYVG